MKRSHFLLSALICCCCACDAVDDSPCGLKQTQDIYLLGSALKDTTTGLYYSYMDGNNNRVFQYSQIAENVCTHEHVKTSARVALLDESTTGISARASVSWQFFFEETCEATKTGSDLKCNLEAGLKQAFGDELSGWCVPAIEVYFPTRGSYSADTNFLIANVISVELTSNYREYVK